MAHHASTRTSTETSTETSTDVTIIGLGLMGRALADAVLAAGHRVTVWNRTAAKAEGLVSRGARLAESVESAVLASPVSIVCVADYESLQQAFASVSGELDGRVLVNLTSGEPEQARELARWADQGGARSLDGAIMAVPSTIGTADAIILLSGSRAAFETQQPLLAALGDATFLGDDHGLSALYDVAGLSVMWGVLNAWLQGVALLGTAGVDASTFTPFATQVAQETVGWLSGYADQVDRGSYPPDDATLATHAGGIAHLVRVSERLGVDAELPRLFQSLVARALATGQADQSYAALIEQLTPGARTS
ncbi:3-hydroxyisobutyrate dehydrogenase-like beta-hydroxyacid dehydrogenase [Cellulosimicrobium cellulans]|uniref:NAD(P)-dependent oxidoreductase n=1 Tax=Cellulosimicrobium cellulans TaxID=1710 RepID=UPI00195BE81D|nr:NAD(P)-binding domain-containing protein [Cellulosimicrobium cellulans]MBM7818421.1 3-hydroxyisobutyrate dehydrogenase-like beta-hydroxyacid dehydrogenase [Cellulosimicrobium cellulans]